MNKNINRKNYIKNKKMMPLSMKEIITQKNQLFFSKIIKKFSLMNRNRNIKKINAKVIIAY